MWGSHLPLQFPWALVREGSSSPVSETLGRGQPLAAPAPCQSAGLAVSISWKTLQDLTLGEGKRHLGLAGPAEQNPQLVTSD